MNRFDTFFLCRNLSFSSNTNFRSNLLIVLIIRNILFSCMVLYQVTLINRNVGTLHATSLPGSVYISSNL